MEKSIYTEQSARLCAILLRERKKAGMKQEDVAKHLGRNQSFVTKYENGERRLDVIEFMEICRILSYDPKLVIDELESWSPPKDQS